MPTAPELRWVRRARRGISAEEAPPRLGVLGGTFNPVTRAHLALAEAALNEFALAEVLFVLPERLPHRTPEDAPLEARLRLVEAALEPFDRFALAVCTHGLFVDIAAALAPHYPAATKVFFLAGSDAADRILHWDKAEPVKTLEEMFARFDLIVAGRAGQGVIAGGEELSRFRGQIHRLKLPAEVSDISATAVRERARAGQPIDDLVPPAVADAIRRAGLYKS